MQRPFGFSLIELLLVIALMSVLMSFALPSFQHYLQRTQIAEGLTLATPLQMALNETLYETGQVPPSLANLGIEHAPQGRYIQHITLQSGALLITYGNQAHAQLHGKTLRLTPYLNPDQSLIWRCQTGSLPPNVTLAPGAHDQTLASDLPSHLLPQTCR